MESFRFCVFTYLRVAKLSEATSIVYLLLCALLITCGRLNGNGFMAGKQTVKAIMIFSDCLISPLLVLPYYYT